MNVSAAACRRLAWINLPGALLIALLQRTPALRLLAGVGDRVLASPVGQILRGAVTAAALGAMHSRAGATTFVISPGNPVSGTVGTPLNVGFTYVGTPSSPARFTVNGGGLPPGLDFIPAPVGGTIDSGTPGISGTPTAAGTFSVTVQGFNAEGLTNNAQQVIVFNISGGGSAPTAPAISAQPQDVAVAVGGSATFSVTASGDPPPAFQWRKNGANIAGATGATLALGNVQPSDAGTYSVVVTNSAGSATSGNAVLTVNSGPVPLAIVLQPGTRTVARGHTAVFNVGATGATGFQWRRNGANIAGATGATLVLPGAGDSDAAAYSVVVSGAGGASVASSTATLSVVDEPNFGRLINLSILTDIPTPGDSFTMGYVVGAAPGSKPLVIRAAGPALAAIGVPGTLDDPRLEFFAGSTKSGENDNWGGSAELTAAMANVGAFPFLPTSLDAAAATSVAASANSVKVSAAGNGTGTVIAEIYDATPGGTFSAATPRLINVSVLKHLGGGSTMGFVIGGSTAKTVLVRAVGPTLGQAPFFVPGVVADPQLILLGQGGSVRFGENNDWGGSAAMAAAFRAVGAFDLPADSRDAALLATLAPGNYTAEVKGVADTTGVAIIEVYEVP